MSGRKLEGHVAAKGGFTIVELLVAMFLLVVAFLGLVSVLMSTTRWQALSEARAEMAAVADAKMEQLRAAGSSSSADTLQLAIGGSLTTATAPQADTTSGRGGREFERLWSVAAGPGGTRDVTLRIRPLVDLPSTPARIDFTTLILVR